MKFSVGDVIQNVDEKSAGYVFLKEPQIVLAIESIMNYDGSLSDRYVLTISEAIRERIQWDYLILSVGLTEIGTIRIA